MSEEAAVSRPGPSPSTEITSVEPFVKEFLKLLDEGWEPNLEEYLRRVPEPWQEKTFQALDRALEARSYEPEDEAPPEDPPSPRVVQTADEAFAPRAWETLERSIAEEPAEPAESAESEDEADAEELVALVVEDETVEAVPTEDDLLPDVPGYRVDQRLGRGPRGASYAAWDEADKKRVALKVLKFDVGVDVLPASRRAAGVAHGVIQPMTGLVPDRTLVMDLVDGEPIDWACRGLTIEDRATILLSIARALAAAHAEGLVHGALKPSNVRVTSELEPVLLDFGVPQPEVEMAWTTYAAPEQIKGRGASAESDVFSFGSVMYSVLTGQEPFAGLEQIAESDPAMPRRVDAALPEALQAICLSCLTRSPRGRPTAAEVAENLERYVGDRPVLLRPACYRHRLHRQVRSHLAEVHGWTDLGFVTGAESDLLDRFYRRIVEHEEHWAFDRRRLPAGRTPIVAGTALLVAAAALGTWLARGAVAPVWGWGVACTAWAALVSGGILAQRRRDRQEAGIFLLGAVVATLPAGFAALSAGGLFAEELTRLLPATLLALGLSAVSWVLVRTTTFAWTTAILGIAAFGVSLLAVDVVARAPLIQGLCLLPLTGFALAGVPCDKLRRFSWAIPFYLVSLVALIVAPLWLALAEAIPARLLPEWLDPRLTGMAAHGLLLLGVGAALARSRHLDLRQGARLLEPVAAILLLGALFANAFLVGGPTALALHLGGVAAVLGMGALRRSRFQLLSGAVGLALCAPLALSLGVLRGELLGAGLLVVGAVLGIGAYLRTSRGRRD